FQAEDGIRDFHVTGVQTCALPILLEALADYDDELLRRYLEGETISAEMIRAAIRKGTLASRITPVFCGAAYKNKGVRRLLDAIKIGRASCRERAQNSAVDETLRRT